MDKLISPNQLTFLKGKVLGESEVVVKQLVDLAKRSKKHCLVMKVYFGKTYDSIS